MTTTREAGEEVRVLRALGIPEDRIQDVRTDREARPYVDALLASLRATARRVNEEVAVVARWKVMRWECTADDCWRAVEAADHDRRDPETCTPSCSEHGPMRLVGEVPLLEFTTMSQRLADEWNAGYRHGRDAVKTEARMYVCPVCGRAMIGADERCSGSFLDKDHPPSVAPVLRRDDAEQPTAPGAVPPRVAVEIVDHIADQLEAREDDAQPNDRWAGSDWRVGRSSRHTELIYERALGMVPDHIAQAYRIAMAEADGALATSSSRRRGRP